MPTNGPKHFTIEITKFEFPEDLDDDKANFRLQVDLRHRTPDGDLRLKTVILPGLELYWECDKGKNEENVLDPAYMLARRKGKNGWEPAVHLARLGPWGRRFRVDATELFELRVTVFDVARLGWLGKLGEAIGGALKAVVAGPLAIAGLMESLVDEASAAAGRKMAGGDDKVLMTQSAEFTPNHAGDGGGSWLLRYGYYVLEFTASVKLP